MKIQITKNILLVFLLSVFPLLSASAQTQPTVPTPEPKPTSSRDVFPKLPPSSICTKEGLIGMWKLLMVYEVPSGREIEFYTVNPLQYFVFEPDSRFGEYTSMLHAITLKDIRNTVLSKQKTVQQFSINKSGMIFFYKDSIAVDSLACFMVAKTAAPFRIGQLLLMPSEKAAKGRMVKIYQKVFPELELPPTIIFKDNE